MSNRKRVVEIVLQGQEVTFFRRAVDRSLTARWIKKEYEPGRESSARVEALILHLQEDCAMVDITLDPLCVTLMV